MKKKLLFIPILCFATTIAAISFNHEDKPIYAEEDIVTSIKGHTTNTSTTSIQMVYAVESLNMPSGAEEGVIVFADFPTINPETHVYQNPDFVCQRQGTVTNNTKTYNRYVLTDLSYANVGDDLFAISYVLYNGTYTYSEIDTYSILEYILKKLDSPDAKETFNDGELTFGEYLHGVIDFATLTQRYQNYATDALVSYLYEAITSGTIYLYRPGGQYEFIIDEQNDICELTRASNFTSSEFDIPKLVRYKNKYLNITSIGDEVFKGNQSLTNVTLSSSITSIGDNCFEECTNLRSVTSTSNKITIGEKAFYSCIELEKFICNQITSFPKSCFEYCTSLSEISVNADTFEVDKVGYHAFRGCAVLRNFNSKYNDPLDIEGNIGEEAFSGCIILREVTIGIDAIDIGKNAFYQCYCLKINLSRYFFGHQSFDVAYNYGENWFGGAFVRCNQIIRPITPSNIAEYPLLLQYSNEIPILYEDDDFVMVIDNKYIERGARITKIKNSSSTVTIPDTVSVTIDGNTQTYNVTSLDLYSVDKGEMNGYLGLNKIVGGHNIKYIGENSLSYDCMRNLSEIEISSKIIAIEENSFENTEIESLDFSKTNLKYILDSAFENSDLTRIKVPDSLIYIGKCAFKSLSEIAFNYVETEEGEYFNGLANLKNLKMIDDSAFEETPIHEIHIESPIQYIGDSAFASTQCKSLIVSASLIYFGPRAFQNSTIQEANISDLKEIPAYCFYQANIRGTLSLDNIQTIKEYAFHRASILTFNGLPSALITIENNAFDTTTLFNTTYITISDTITYIGKRAFSILGKVWYTVFYSEGHIPTGYDPEWLDLWIEQQISYLG